MARTDTVAGTVADELPLLRLMTAPVGPAGPFKLTVPVLELPPRTEAGLITSDVNVGGSMVSVVDSEDPFKLAVIVAFERLLTPAVVTVNVAVV